MSQSQQDLILAYLKGGNSLTPLDALNRFQCFRLGARIWDLRRAGHKIERQIIQVGDKHYASYSMPQQQEVA